MVALVLAAQAFQKPPVTVIDVGRADAVVSGGPWSFVTHQDVLGESKGRLTYWRADGKQIASIELDRPQALVGTDEKGDPVLQEALGNLRVARGGKLEWAPNQPNSEWLIVDGRWSVRPQLGSLIVSKDRTAWSVERNVDFLDSYGIDAATGRLAILRYRSRKVVLSTVEASGRRSAPIPLTLATGDEILDGYPFCSVGFLDRDRILCGLRIGRVVRPMEKTRTEPEWAVYFCIVSLARGIVTPLFKMPIGEGEMPPPARNGIAVLPDGTVGVLGDRKLMIVRLKR